jgi:hypothetical protein
MKFTVNINQKAVVDLGLQGKLDFIDLAIYDFVIDFMLCDDCHKINIGNEQYYWIKADLIIENLPLLGIATARGVNKRIEKLIGCNLLERCPDNKNLRQSFFKVGKLYKEYKFFTWNESSKPSWNENSKSDINNISMDKYIENDYYNNIDYNDGKKLSLDMSIVAPEMREVVDTWLAYKKEKGKMYKPIGFKNFYKKLCEFSGNNLQVAMAIIEQSMANNYDGIFPLRNNNNNNYGRETITDKIRRTVEEANTFSEQLRSRIGEQADVCDGDTDEAW